MGNSDAFGYWTEFFSIVGRYKTPREQNAQVSSIKPFPPDQAELIKEIIDNRCYNELTQYISKQNSRLAFFVLGAFLMNVGAKMSEDLREKILHYSSWKYEENQLSFQTIIDIEERKKHLFDFRKKVKNYKNGVKVKFGVITSSNGDPTFHLPIDYRIKKL